VIRTEAFQASVIYRFWNPQATGADAGAVSPLLALAGAVGSPLAAFAQADPVYKARPGAGPAVYNWTGFYAGAHGGYGWSLGGNLKIEGWLAGAQVGYNHQVNQWVFGVEADGSFTDIQGQVRVADDAPPSVANFADYVEGLATIAGRLGYAWNNVLFYGKGGAAAVRNHLQFTYNASGNSREWQWGWMAGVGLEYGIGQNWSIKVEYNYLDFGTKGYTFQTCNSCPGPAAPFDVELKQQIQVVKLGLNWRFYNPSPVVARY
jgi:outer membrane immunogenic protein